MPVAKKSTVPAKASRPLWGDDTLLADARTNLLWYVPTTETALRKSIRYGDVFWLQAKRTHVLATTTKQDFKVAKDSWYLTVADDDGNWHVYTQEGFLTRLTPEEKVTRGKFNEMND